jgi:hypothetical protein
VVTANIRAMSVRAGTLIVHSCSELRRVRTMLGRSGRARILPAQTDRRAFLPLRALPDTEAKTVALSKVDSWKRRDEFPKELVTLPGASYPSSALVDACYTLLFAPKSAALN